MGGCAHINTANYCYDINVFLVAKAAAKIALPGFFIQKFIFISAETHHLICTFAATSSVFI